MCDYSLERQHSRPAAIGDRLVSTGFPDTPTRGFASPADINVAVCLRPGTELGFAAPIEVDGLWNGVAGVSRPQPPYAGRVAIFRQINSGARAMHHDALELENGSVILLTQLTPGQQAVVLQVPAEPAMSHEHAEESIPAAVPAVPEPV